MTALHEVKAAITWRPTEGRDTHTQKEKNTLQQFYAITSTIPPYFGRDHSASISFSTLSLSSGGYYDAQ